LARRIDEQREEIGRLKDGIGEVKWLLRQSQFEGRKSGAAMPSAVESAGALLRHPGLSTTNGAGFAPVRKLKASAFVINYNEAPFLDACLSSLAVFDELIFIDKSSTDSSREIAARYTGNIHVVPWSPVVEDTRAFADALCSHEWRFFLDADEMINSAAIAEIDRVITENACDIVEVPRINYIFGELSVTNIYARQFVRRLYRGGSTAHPAGTHRQIGADGAKIFTIPADGPAHIVHFNQDSVYEYLEKANRYTETYDIDPPPFRTPDDVFNKAREQVEHAAKSVAAAGGSTYDAVVELVTGMYYVTEHLKKWEKSRDIDVAELYAKTMTENIREIEENWFSRKRSSAS
jgi:glycosyltransferase involved in cell wall biosynthesis